MRSKMTLFLGLSSTKSLRRSRRSTAKTPRLQTRRQFANCSGNSSQGMWPREGRVGREEQKDTGDHEVRCICGERPLSVLALMKFDGAVLGDTTSAPLRCKPSSCPQLKTLRPERVYLCHSQIPVLLHDVVKPDSMRFTEIIQYLTGGFGQKRICIQLNLSIWMDVE
jgi:hypothetical protein